MSSSPSRLTAKSYVCLSNCANSKSGYSKIKSEPVGIILGKTKTKKIYQKHKTHGVTVVSVVPVRRQPSDKSEMISQLLFGELVEVVTRKHNSWCRVILEWDGYEGWVDRKQIKLISQKHYNLLLKKRAYALDLCAPVYGDRKNIPILLGSTLPNYDGISLKIIQDRLRYSGQSLFPESTELKAELVRKIAFKYLAAPYLWGGRSPFGIDCSGFIQNVFKVFGIRIPRDAYQQASIGESIDFVDQSVMGDLAFFANEDGKIIHVGMVLEDGMIIHASGEVRVDKLDHFGIFNQDQRRYTHFLRIIKRVVEFSNSSSQSNELT